MPCTSTTVRLPSLVHRPGTINLGPISVVHAVYTVVLNTRNPHAPMQHSSASMVIARVSERQHIDGGNGGGGDVLLLVTFHLERQRPHSPSANTSVPRGITHRRTLCLLDVDPKQRQHIYHLCSFFFVSFVSRTSLHGERLSAYVFCCCFCSPPPPPPHPLMFSRRNIDRVGPAHHSGRSRYERTFPNGGKRGNAVMYK